MLLTLRGGQHLPGPSVGIRIAGAKERCPDLVVMPYEFERYSAIALDVYRVLHEVTPHVMGVSVDEAYIDATGCGAPAEVAALIRSRVLERTVGPGIYIARRVTGFQLKK